MVKRLDLILAAGVLILAAVIYIGYMGGAQSGGEAVITVDGAVVYQMPLSQNDSYRVETPEGYNIVEIRDGFADVTEADCRDGVCVEHKRIQKTGETIVCLPHKMVVTIIGGQADDADVVVG